MITGNNIDATGGGRNFFKDRYRIYRIGAATKVTNFANNSVENSACNAMIQITF
jgi:hypothetical protein